MIKQLIDAGYTTKTLKIVSPRYEDTISKDQMRMMEVVVYDPRNINSAIGNTGEFNPEDQGSINQDLQLVQEDENDARTR